MKKFRKITSVFFAMLLILQMLPGAVFAQTNDVCEFYLPDVIAVKGKSVTISDVQNYIADEQMKSGLLYASDAYASYISEKAKVSFTKNSITTMQQLSDVPLKLTGDEQYALELPVSDSLEGGIYSVTVQLATADDKGITPYVITIGRFTVEDNSADVFEVTIDYLQGMQDSTVTVENFQNLVSDERLFGLLYVSSYYAESMTQKATIEFDGLTNIYSKSTTDIPLKNIGNDVYNLEIPVSDYFEDGTYRVTIDLPLAPEKGIDGVRPYKIIINNFVIGDLSQAASFEWHLSDVLAMQGEEAIIQNIQKLLPEEMTDGLEDAAIEYDGEGVSRAEYNFFNSGGSNKQNVYLQNPLVKNSEGGYDLKIPDFENVETNVEYELKISLISENAKQYSFRILSYVRVESSGCSHSWSEWYVKTAPTASEPGLQIRRCSLCLKEENQEIEALGTKNTTFNISDTVTISPIEGAEVIVSNADKTVNVKEISDAQGKTFFDLANGIYSVQIIKNGYQLRNFTVEKRDAASEFTAYLNENDILEVNTQVQEMSRQQIIDAGIDVDAPENKHVYECIAVLKFTPVVSGEGSINPSPVRINLNYYCNETGSILNPKPVYSEGGAVIYPVSKDIYLIIHSRTTWLKEMFDVQLVVSNTSEIEIIEECAAKLKLPEGLSLATMKNGEQSLDMQIGTIAPKETKELHWYLCGDEEGDYYIDGVISAVRSAGGIREDVNTRFTTAEPISVLAGSAMKLTIEAEKTAVAGTAYKVKYTLQNMSDKTINNVKLEVLGGKFCKAYEITDILHEAMLGDVEDLTGSFNDGYALEDECFEPGEALMGIFEITFGVGIDTEYIEYMVTDMFTVTGSASTTTIPTEIILVDSVNKHNWDEGVETKGKGCTDAGEIVYTCTDAGCSETKTLPTAAKGHILSEWKERRTANCCQTGEKYRACENCDYEIKEPIEKAEHIWNTGAIVKEPEENANGEIMYTCTYCGETDLQKTLSVLNEGKFGENSSFSWKLYDNGILKLDGEGELPTDSLPWTQLCDKVKAVTVGEEVTRLGADLFAGCTNVESVSVPEGVRAIDENVFADCCNLKKISYGGDRSSWEKIDIGAGNENITEDKIYYSKASISVSEEKISIYPTDEEGMLLIAMYKEHKFTGYKFIRIKYSIERTIDQLDIDNNVADELRFFLWKSSGKAVPLCNRQSVNLSES